MYWTIVRREHSGPGELVIGYADTEVGAREVCPRDDPGGYHVVRPPRRSRDQVTRDTAISHELIEVEHRITKFKIRGRLVAWDDDGVTLILNLTDRERTIPIRDVWAVKSVEPR